MALGFVVYAVYGRRHRRVVDGADRADAARR
jgi:hypothetical protein